MTNIGSSNLVLVTGPTGFDVGWIAKGTPEAIATHLKAAQTLGKQAH